MNRTIRTAIALFFVLTVIIFGQTSLGLSEPFSVEHRAVDYVKTALPFDMNHYTATVDKVYSLPQPPSDPTICQSVTVDLKSNDSELAVVCMFLDDALYQCSPRIVSGAAVLDRQYGSLSEMAARILQGQDSYTGEDSSALTYALGLVDENKSMNATFGDVTLRVGQIPIPTSLHTVNGVPVPDTTNMKYAKDFLWTIQVNGVHFNAVSLTFQDGLLSNLQDDRAEHPVGGTTVNTTKDQAIANVIQFLGNYTNKYNLTVISTTASLIGYPRNNHELYPAWFVNVGFDQNVEDINAKVWADTGVLFECYQGGSPFNGSTLRIAPYETQMPTATPQPAPEANSAPPTAQPQAPENQQSLADSAPTGMPTMQNNVGKSGDSGSLGLAVLAVASVLVLFFAIMFAIFGSKIKSLMRTSLPP